MKRNPFVLIVKVAFFLALFGCFDLTGDKDAVVEGFNPPRGVAGDNITIYGRDLNTAGTATVTFNGVPATIVSTNDSAIVVQVPAGASNGELRFANATVNTAVGDFFVGAPGSVPEVEPNDAINGADATLDAGTQNCTGTLSSVADKDHFRFQSLIPGHIYRIKVNPKVVGVVYVNGAAVTLDSSGEADYTNQNETMIVGLTGGTGDYTVTISRESSGV